MLVGAALITAPASHAGPGHAGPGATPALVAQAIAPTPAPKPAIRVAAASSIDRVEARITDLRAKLNITPAQESLWNHVTQVMRENATTMDALRTARAARERTMTAVDDLASYGAIAEAHAAGLRTFIPAFTELYGSMSDAQKQNADAVFHGRHVAAKLAAPKTR
jgi:hypothetical protein